MQRVTRVVSHSHSRLLHAAGEFIASYKESLVLLPNSSSGEGLLRIAPSASGVHLRSLAQLAVELARASMAEQGLVPLTALGRESVLTRVTFAARKHNRLDYFSPVAGMPGFVHALAKTVEELRLARVSPSELAEIGAPAADLAGLLAAYENELAQRGLADFAEILRQAQAVAQCGNHRLLGLPLALLHAPLDWTGQRDLFDAVAGRAPAILLAVTPQDSLAGRGVSDPDNPAAQNALEHLRRNLFLPEPAQYQGSDAVHRFQFFSAPGEGLEAAEIARRILALGRDGTPFDQIAILLRSPDRYQPMIEEALRRAGIPAWFSRGSARPDPSGRAFLALLACKIEKVSASRFAEYMSLGQIPRAGASAPWIPPRDELLNVPVELFQNEDSPPDEPAPPAPSAWERLLVDAAVINGRDRWERRLNGLEAEFELRLASLSNDDAQRGHQARQLELLRSLKSFAMPLVDALHSLPSSASWGEWIEQLSALARRALRDPEGVLATLAELGPMAEVGPATIEEVVTALTERLRFLRAEPARRRWGSVFIGSIEEARARDFAVVFLPGLAEGLFPQRTLEDALLLDSFREVLRGLPRRKDRVRDERRLLHIAVGAAREKLVASYPRMDVASARPRVPSFYALELPRALAGKLPEVEEFERKAREAAPARLNRPAPHTAADAIDDAEYDLVAIEAARENQGKARHVIDANESLARSLRARWTRWRPPWKDADGLIASAPGVLEALSTHGLRGRLWSPSALEKFAVCPYQFALSGIHRLQPREESAALEQLDPRTRGALFHEVQFALLGELKSAGLLPFRQERLKEMLERADTALNRVAADYKERLAPAIDRVWASEIEDLRTDLRGWLQHAARNDEEWEPVHFEFGFGLRDTQGRDPSSIASEAELDEGARLRGSIDLVERHTGRGTFRITDHKTGKAPEKIPHWVGGGRALQPLLYSLAVEKLLGVTVESGRLFYATQRGGYSQMQVNVTPHSRLVMQRLLADIDSSISGGFLAPYPGKDACKICDYRIACGPYEEQRISRKSRDDERLEPLIEIRGMA
jgi:ATP-dependent helicase/nuclease subunit B